MSKFSRIGKLLRDVKKDESGLALVEFAVSLPFFMGLSVGGIEIANYASVIMQLNQITIHTADNAARMGDGSRLSDRPLTELHINDVFEGTLREGDRVALAGAHKYIDPVTNVESIRGNSKIILSSIEPVSPFNAANPKYRIRWQRCAGFAQQYSSSYGTTSSTPTSDGFGPAGRKSAPPPDGSVMFVELQYYFQPKIVNGFTRLTDRTIKQTASMVVRERRDYKGPTGGDGVYPVTGVTKSACT
ncbi:TadE/TadG family type IV pilus assembly protein [Sphingorhabdus arenilitoris]|uniref:TadE/TadG family type IV pilus assembly protein n=1 Tax=Sphingorhabdus arenilitoris TaxID=1490041 RepID=A0ABV8RFP3_9SPHN